MSKYSYTFADVILTALSVLFIHDSAMVLPPVLTLFLSALIAIVFFHAINISHFKKMYQQVWQNKWAWMKLMLTIVAMWLATIYGPVYVSPTIFIQLVFVVLCLLGISANYKEERDAFLLISGVGIFICAALIVYHYLNTTVITSYVFLGIILGALGGATAFIYSKQSYQLAHKANLTATQILAVRFWLMEGICLLFLPYGSSIAIDLHGALFIVAIAFASLILPIFCAMKGILQLGPEKYSAICGTIPAVTYIFESIHLHRFNTLILLLNVMTAIFIALPFFKSKLKKESKSYNL